LATIESRVRKLEVDMFYGDGKDNPSLTTRVSLLEEIVGKIDTRLTKLGWLGISTLLAVLGEIATKLVH
jgi:hypothetical protein